MRSSLEPKIREALSALKNPGPSDFIDSKTVIQMREAAQKVFVYSTMLVEELQKREAELRAQLEQRQADEKLLATLKRIGIAASGGTVNVRA